MALKKLKTLKVIFNNPISLSEISDFRVGISKVIPGNAVLFHHHIDDDTLVYRYPLIQYKRINGKAAILCLEEGADEFNRFLQLKNWKIDLGKRAVELEVEKLTMNFFNVNIWEKKFTYRISNWIAFNKKNYEEYPEIDSLKERIEKLEKILVAHILSFAQGIKWDVDKKIELAVNDIIKQDWISYKEVRFMTFDLTFTTNVSLPDDIGLGKAPSTGFGMIRKINVRTNRQHETQLEAHDLN